MPLLVVGMSRVRRRDGRARAFVVVVVNSRRRREAGLRRCVLVGMAVVVRAPVEDSLGSDAVVMSELSVKNTMSRTRSVDGFPCQVFALGRRGCDAEMSLLGVVLAWKRYKRDVPFRSL